MPRKRASRTNQGPTYEFVDTACPLTNLGNEVRTTIRRQAARSGCRRRRRENGAHDYTTKSDITPVSLLTGFLHAAPLSHPSYNGYETMRVKYNFDITSLSSFTHVDLAVNASRSLQDNQKRLVSILQKQPSSFLAYLPSRYGSRPFLDDAMHCVAARATELLGHYSTQLLSSACYSRALRTLNFAIQTDDNCLASDIYCATRLLVLYELLGHPDTNALAFHNQAGVNLLKRRGPASDMSSFDCMLLQSQGPYILISEMYENKASMFEAPEWQQYFNQAADSETDADSCLWWRFFRTNSFLPGILRDIGILFRTVLDPYEYAVQSLHILERTKKMHRTHHDCHVVYQHSPPHPSSLFEIPILVESPARIRLRVFFMYAMMYICRIQATLSLSENERATSEVEAQTFAAQTLWIERVTANLDPAMAWHLEQRNNLACSIVRTREEWVSAKEHGKNSEELKSFLAQRWLNWENSWKDSVLVEELEYDQFKD